MRCGVIIVAAGEGKRLGFSTPKAFIPLGSKLLYQHSLMLFQNHPSVQEIVLVVPEGFENKPEEKNINRVKGGATRQESVANGLEALSPACDICLVHDAARPFVSPLLVDRLLDFLKKGLNAIPALPILDTVKRVEEDKIIQTLERKNLWGAQTPQACQVALLKEAIRKSKENNWIATDEASLLERLGIPVYVVAGDPLNIKITTKGDLEFARTIFGTFPIRGTSP